jgi:AsmA protein
LTFNGAGARPVVDAKLTLGKVDLDPYLPSPGAAPASAPAPSAAHPAPARGAAPPRANAAPAGLGGLRRVDGTADLTLAGLVAHKLTLGPAHIVLRLKDGRLASNLDRAAFYGGGATAALTVDATTATPRMTLSATLAGVQLGPLLAAAADSSRLQGTADLDLKVAGAGASRRAIMASLSGSGRINVRNGALRGIDLAKLMSGVSSTLKNPSAAHLPKATGSSEKTEFSQLSGSYTIHNGILVNNDLSLRGASFTAGGTGRVNLVDRTLNYRLVAKLDLPSRVRIGGVTMSEVTVPVVVSGPWNAPDYRPDLAAMVRDLAKGRALHELQKRLGGGKGLGQVLRGLTGGGGGSSGGNVLQRLFGH